MRKIALHSYILLTLTVVSALLPTHSVYALERRNVTDLQSLENDKEIVELVRKCQVAPIIDSLNDDEWRPFLVVEVPEGTEIVRFDHSLDPGNEIVFPTAVYYACPLAIFNSIQAKQKLADETWTTRVFIDVFDVILWLFRVAVELALRFSGGFFALMLSEGTFIQNDIVQQAWPFIQGIANLGFIFALLYIALATTLRIESVSTSIQRLLPKLLIGAILVNFSLVVGGLLIDLSRLLMAVEIKVVAGPDITATNLGARLIAAISAYEAVFKTLEFAGQGLQAYLILSLQNLIVMGALAVGLFIVSLNLFIRYVALLVLLILSPFAYLALALPQTKSIFTQWWGLFLKWVFYGPIVLFFLSLIIRIQGSEIINIPENGFSGSATLQYLIRFAIVITFLYIGHVVGKKAAGAGSDAILGWAKEHPKTTAAAVGTILTGGLGGAALGAIGMFGAQKTGTAAQYAYKRTGIPEALKIRQSSIAKRERDRIDDTRLVEMAKYRYGTDEYRQDIQNAKAIQDAPANADITSDTFASKKLRSNEAGKAIKPEHIRAILDRALMEGDNSDQLEAMISNPTIVAKMNNTDTAIFNTEINNRLADPRKTPIEKEQAKRLLNTFQRSLREADKKREDDKKLPDAPAPKSKESK